jgi:hypothetical protein
VTAGRRIRDDGRGLRRPWLIPRAITALLPAIGFSKICALVADVSILGLLTTVTLLPEPKGASLEELTETRSPDNPVAWPDASDHAARRPGPTRTT